MTELFFIFVEGADTEPSKVPIYVVKSNEHAASICNGMKETEYQIYDFSFKECTRSDLDKAAAWLQMIVDVQEGVYGDIVGGIYKMIDGMCCIMGIKRRGETPVITEPTKSVTPDKPLTENQVTELRKDCGKRNRELIDKRNSVDQRLEILKAEFPKLNLDRKSLKTIQGTESNRVNNSKAKKSKTKTS